MALKAGPPDHRIAYGSDPNQFGELRLPPGNGPHPVVVLIHGGCWMPYAGASAMGPMAEALKKDGIATWNIEYRRLTQSGGGWPGTYLDVGHVMDHLRSIAGAHRLDLSRVVVVGHSAGAHLAMWTGIRMKLNRGSSLFIPNPLAVTGIVNLAGRIDMTQGIQEYEATCQGEPVVTNLLGGSPEQVSDRYRDTSANRHVPLGLSQTLIWGEYEEYVPMKFAEDYVQAATKAGDRIQFIRVPGVGHFETASPVSRAWPAVQAAIRSLIQGGK